MSTLDACTIGTVVIHSMKMMIAVVVTADVPVNQLTV